MTRWADQSADGGSLCLDGSVKCPSNCNPSSSSSARAGVLPAGSDKAQEASFRLISSTNRDPIKAINDGGLREDLYYRINTIEIECRRFANVSMTSKHLAEHFLRELARSISDPYAEFLRIVPATVRAFVAGNVRELQHAVERAMLLGKGESIDVYALASGQTATRPVKTMASQRE